MVFKCLFRDNLISTARKKLWIKIFACLEWVILAKFQSIFIIRTFTVITKQSTIQNSIAVFFNSFYLKPAMGGDKKTLNSEFLFCILIKTVYLPAASATLVAGPNYIIFDLFGDKSGKEFKINRT